MNSILWILISLGLTVSANCAVSGKCSSDDECEAHWPGAVCSRSRCRCPKDYTRKKSDSRGWVCVAVVDAATGEAGPPLTCPLPAGAGYTAMLREAGRPVLCNSKKASSCPEGFECIQGLSLFGPMDGACCPDRVTTCSLPKFEHDDGHLIRWAYVDGKCETFKWNPERSTTANAFTTKEHCEDYCVNNTFSNLLPL